MPRGMRTNDSLSPSKTRRPRSNRRRSESSPRPGLRSTLRSGHGRSSAGVVSGSARRSGHQPASHLALGNPPRPHGSRPEGATGSSLGPGRLARVDTGPNHDGCALSEVVMALEVRKNATMGCAFFSTVDGKLYLLYDVPMADLQVAGQLLTHVQPTTLLVSARAPEYLLVFLEEQSGSTDQGNVLVRFNLRALPSSDFTAETAADRIFGLQDSGYIPDAVQAMMSTGDYVDRAAELDAPEGTGDRESRHVQLIRYGAVIDLESQASINCAGAVLSDLHRRRSMNFLPDGQRTEVVFGVSSLQMFSLSDYVFISADDMTSLQLLQSEDHPNSQVSGSSSNSHGPKESLSLYGLFHHLACTPQGRTQLRQLFLRPTSNLDIIYNRQRAISLLLRPENAVKLKELSSALRKLKNARNVVAQLRKGIDFPTDGVSFDTGVWATLRRFAAQALRLREVVATLTGAEETEVTRKLVDALQPPDLIAVGDMVNKVIDFEQSKSRQRSSVRVGVDAQLDELKRRYDGMSSFLTEVIDHVNRTLPEWACQYIRSCIFLPQLGFLMVVEQDPRTGNGRYEGDGTGNDHWEKLFTADGAVCYKNRYMKELDQEYGDMYCEIGDREVEIIHDLATRVLKHEGALAMASDACGVFDAVLALAVGAGKYRWTVPQLTTDSTIQIKGGRHPLQELVVPTFVPNDCDLSGGRWLDHSGDGEPAQALVLTGPNHSGKSIYIKQTAIIVYLAHIGSFVPAEQATIGLTDKFLTRISTRESVSRNESAFAIDLKHVAQAIRQSTAKSLVLVDEFGKGTNADDGAGLLAAFLEHFLSLGEDAPRMLVSTHFHELLEGDYLGPRGGLCLGHMDVRTHEKSREIEDQLTYLFKLTPGHSTSSFGARCAALNGVPASIVERAEAMALLLSRNEDLGSACAKLSPHEQQQLEDAEAVARRFVQADFNLQSEGCPGQGSNGAAVQFKLRDMLSSRGRLQ